MKIFKTSILFIITLSLAMLAGCGDNGPNIPDPEITGIQPDSGPPGTVVTISGKGFSQEASENRVTFGGVEATVNSATASEIEILCKAWTPKLSYLIERSNKNKYSALQKPTLRPITN